ncbi:type 2 isopentenyl-diphosphate Delta-isomerase [Methanococcus aeolicus]|uniref:Isopentenyl-diphosphate delta-isomerase n=1 Tax=Methanococcus aeolicus (strain ATCC BAA-1280 / DSM 17508 / OCM 812 / Nankai-3) TaxID=419665 RepID=IDI2_META3|nr:type 2 isopentenyl-diphosphate Delta-isomerase [Methanococcus aeolicus]A6UW89.1 RecName: Full=Isopentenyl-diphosphate delta-isomerase; Short=IPP isomerase; AltName: Full=Isopentenyl diphosphate:dimethylallyl diphosphate isomerase; AltName: Full=Isopentenyl pyrophosphate isomerase; AltName: Full=Type 2 isopentenyl diphosphate isomerase; Short=IDI-2 [Methanococcus aeolicus Nankai-3]ABR56761.1 isopentenyl-diphosphate delta-isomerase, type 2 [Methanococcus aeolicus Nankai-3]UXM84761.1 type 2 isop
MSNDIEFRKLEHLFVCNYCDVEYKKGTLLEDVELIHSGISNCDLEDIDTSINLFGKNLGAPIIVAAITGGHSKAKEINKNIAIAIDELNLGMGVGSQRAALINEELMETYSVVRDYTSSLVLGNLGAVNFIEDGWDEETIHKAVEMIDADGMAIHFNPLQEAIQPEGDYNFKGIEILKDIMENYNKTYNNKSNKKIPFIAKQVGEGFSKEDALLLNGLGFDSIDVGGSGGTSWAAVEYYRIKDEESKKFSKKYLEWGIPTAASILEVKQNFDKPIIATGGIRSGMDIAKSMAIGAQCCGVALPVLKAALRGSEDVIKLIENYIEELKTTMFLMGCDNVNELMNSRYIIKNELKEWI